MTSHQADLFEKADRAAQTGHLALDDGDPAGNVNRAYYAAFYAASAALLAVDETPKSHAGVLCRFAVWFIAPGLVEAAIGRTLPFAAQARRRADYEALAVTDANAADLLADVERFVSTVGRSREEQETIRSEVDATCHGSMMPICRLST